MIKSKIKSKHTERLVGPDDMPCLAVDRLLPDGDVFLLMNENNNFRVLLISTTEDDANIGLGFASGMKPSDFVLFNGKIELEN